MFIYLYKGGETLIWSFALNLMMRVSARVVEEVKKAARPVDINYVARRLGAHWASVYKAVADLVIDAVQRHPKILDELPVVPLKTSKSLLLFPKSLWQRVKGDVSEDV